MYTLGHSFIPAPIHAGGLRYHGMSPLVSAAIKDKLLNPLSIDQLECYEAGVLFARPECILPAPETTHAIAATIREANKAREEGKEKVILFNFSGCKSAKTLVRIYLIVNGFYNVIYFLLTERVMDRIYPITDFIGRNKMLLSVDPVNSTS